LQPPGDPWRAAEQVFMMARTSPAIGAGRAWSARLKPAAASRRKASSAAAETETTARFPLRQRPQSVPPASIAKGTRLPLGSGPAHSAQRSSAGPWPIAARIASSQCTSRG
jgi:hypothetical protein